MRVTEKLVNSPEEEGVTLEYIRLTKDSEEKRRMDEREIFMIDSYITDVFVDI